MICMRLMSGLGNQMFQYALGRRLANEQGTDLILDATHYAYVPKRAMHYVTRTYDLDVFNINARLLDPDREGWLPCYVDSYTHHFKHAVKRAFNLYKHIDGYQVVEGDNPFALDNKVFASGRNSYLIGYWQNEKYFKPIEAQIRNDFVFKNRFDMRIEDLAEEMAGTHSVCLNVRRGDFVTNQLHGFAGVDYIYQALDRIHTAIELEKVYVFSDEIDWCRENLRFNVPHFFVGHDFAGCKFSSYLHLMTKCRHFIIPNSTFGWWSAWLSKNPQKIVIAPKRWLSVPNVDTSGIIPEGWITI